MGKVAGEPGFEPGLTESESVGLPLTYSPTTAFERWLIKPVRGHIVQFVQDENPCWDGFCTALHFIFRTRI